MSEGLLEFSGALICDTLTSTNAPHHLWFRGAGTRQTPRRACAADEKSAEKRVTVSFCSVSAVDRAYRYSGSQNRLSSKPVAVRPLGSGLLHRMGSPTGLSRFSPQGRVLPLALARIDLLDLISRTQQSND